jgi:hypothetical protein
LVDPATGTRTRRVPRPAEHPIDTFPALARENWIPSETVTMRTAPVRAVGGYARWISGGEDYHLYLKLAQAGWRFAYVDRPLASVRAVLPGSGRKSSRPRRMRWNNVKLFVAFGLRHPLTPRYPRKLRRLVRSLW